MALAVLALLPWIWCQVDHGHDPSVRLSGAQFAAVGQDAEASGHGHGSGPLQGVCGLTSFSRESAAVPAAAATRAAPAGSLAQAHAPLALPLAFPSPRLFGRVIPGSPPTLVSQRVLIRI